MLFFVFVPRLTLTSLSSYSLPSLPFNLFNQRKLEKNEYALPKEFKHDVNLIFTNCMTYNADGSEYYNIAATLKKIFEERYAKMVRESDGE